MTVEILRTVTSKKQPSGIMVDIDHSSSNVIYGYQCFSIVSIT